LTLNEQFEEYVPLGVVAFNCFYDSSLLSLVSKLAPALATGNTCLVLANKLCPLSAFMFCDICTQSGLPAGVLNVIASGKPK
jgi:acyl-CoA reductase-like NAD-dependent aldehyde dehydrogenase